VRFFYKYIKKTLHFLGLDLIRYIPPLELNLNFNEILGYELEKEAEESIGLIKNNTMLSKRRLVTLYQQVAYCEKAKIHGSFVECGVWKGGAVGLMAAANLRLAKTRREIHLFDSFQEICEPDSAFDGKKAIEEVRTFTGLIGRDKGNLIPLRGIYDFMGGAGSLKESRDLLEDKLAYPADFINYHVGWFQDTMPKVSNQMGPIAILRLDGDWYASTKVCLEYLFDKVVKGGVVIIDDYGTYDGCRLALDEFLVNRKIYTYINSVDSDCRYLIKN